VAAAEPGPDSFMATSIRVPRHRRLGVRGGVLLLGIPLDSEMGVASHAVADHEARQGWVSRGRAATNLLTVDANAMNFYSMPPPPAGAGAVGARAWP
jgi:hypothetical protein